jgi:hypothetical protein
LLLFQRVQITIKNASPEGLRSDIDSQDPIHFSNPMRPP